MDIAASTRREIQLIVAIFLEAWGKWRPHSPVSGIHAGEGGDGLPVTLPSRSGAGGEKNRTRGLIPRAKAPWLTVSKLAEAGSAAAARKSQATRYRQPSPSESLALASASGYKLPRAWGLTGILTMG
jgi:hypothetical protein